ncbi:MAG TPA: hypothetical protein VK061_09515 [Bacillota bacterium]|nr:hypothetical protein [Bacillota bacterium]
MQRNMRFAWIASSFALVGQLFIFIGISLYTGDWHYAMGSLIVSISMGIPSILWTWQSQKKKRRNPDKVASNDELK